jgi:protein-tyrosine phosphatase
MTARALLPNVPNLRDVGGHTTRDGGRVRTGLLYRSVDLARATDAQAAALARLGIRAVYDLRTADERAIAPDRLPPGADLVVADVLAESPGSSPAAFGVILEDPASAERALGQGRAARFFVDTYRDFVATPGSRAAYRILFTELARPDGRPGLVHCTSGKDRTGWAAAALLLLLGVPRDRVMEDYLASNGALGPIFDPFVAAFRDRGGDPDLLMPLVEARPEYLESALAEVRATHGSIETYFADGLGIDGAGIAALRAAFTEPA